MLWQTAEVRLSKLRVRDEINEALRYYQSSIFETIPALLADLDRWRSSRLGTVADNPRAISMGSWIGGDRDGNPFVTADVLRLAVDSQATTAFGHHLAALHTLALQLSMSARLITPTPALAELADASGDDSPFRADEPYRRALRGMHARLWSLAAEVLDDVPGPPPHADVAAVHRPRRVDRRPRRRRRLARARTAPASWRAAACDAAAPRRRACSAPTCADSTCARTPTSTSRSSPSCCASPA